MNGPDRRYWLLGWDWKSVIIIGLLGGRLYVIVTCDGFEVSEVTVMLDLKKECYC